MFVTNTKILNCNFRFKCPKDWSSLTDIGVENQRYCGVCNENVHWCTTQQDIDAAISNDQCVAFASETKIWDTEKDGSQKLYMGRLENNSD